MSKRSRVNPHIEVPASVEALKPRQRAFVFAFVCGETAGNASGSYVAAGYKARRGRVPLMDRWDITAAIEDLREVTIRVAEQALILQPMERLQIIAAIARDEEHPPRARLAAIRLDAELRGGFKEITEARTIVVDLVPA